MSSIATACSSIPRSSPPTSNSKFLADLGYEIAPQEIVRRFAGLTGRAMADIVEAETGRKMPDDFHQRTQAEIDLRLAAELKPVPGVHEMLDRLEGRKRCVCSNSSTPRLKISMQRTELWDRFAPRIYSAVEVGDHRAKPDPNVYRYAIAEAGVDPRDAVVLEDSVFGIAAAKAAGARVIGFTGGAHTWPGHADLLTDAGAETVINRLANFPATAEALLAWEGMPG